MNSIATWVGAITVGAILAIHPHESGAEGFTGAEFTEWEVASQDSYIQTSVTMAGVVLTQVQHEMSTCIDNWYLGEGAKDERNAVIRKTISEYSAYHPSGTILAVLIDACGPLQ